MGFSWRRAIMIALILGIFPLACKTRRRALTDESQNLSSDKANFMLSSHTSYNAELPIVFIPESLLAQDGSSLALTDREGGLVVSRFVQDILARVCSGYTASSKSATKLLKPSEKKLRPISGKKASVMVGEDRVALYHSADGQPVQVVVTQKGKGEDDEILFKAEEGEAQLTVSTDEAEKVSTLATGLEGLPADFKSKSVTTEELSGEKKNALFEAAIQNEETLSDALYNSDFAGRVSPEAMKGYFSLPKTPAWTELFFRLKKQRIVDLSSLAEIPTKEKQLMFSEALRLGEYDAAVEFLQAGWVTDLSNSYELSRLCLRKCKELFDQSTMPFEQRKMLFKALVQPHEKVSGHIYRDVLGKILDLAKGVDSYYFDLSWKQREFFFDGIRKNRDYATNFYSLHQSFEVLVNPLKLVFFLPRMSPEEIKYFLLLQGLPKLNETLLKDSGKISSQVVGQKEKAKFNEVFKRAVGVSSEDPALILKEAEEKGLLSLSAKDPHHPRKLVVNDDIHDALKGKTLEELFDEYELFAIGQSLAKDLPPQELAEALGEFRAIIAEKISAKEIAKLSSEEQVRLRPLIRKFKNNASTVQFSNAVAYAHRLGIAGEGARVVVVEDVISEDVKRLRKTKGVSLVSKPAEPPTPDAAHGVHVTGIVQQLAPAANLRIVGYSRDFADNLELHSDGIANASFGSEQGSTKTHEALIPVIESKMLVVYAAGNEAVPYDLKRGDPQQTGDQEYLTKQDADTKGRLILVGNLEAGNLVAHDSNFPGDSPLQANFLWTLGSDVLSYSRPEPFEKMSGTSMATPVVSGAAALVKSKYSHFTPKELQEVLLESADRDFWMQRDGLAIHVVEPGRAVKPEVNDAGETAGTVEWAFNPHVFGKGILNVRRALDYAYFKNKYQLDPESIRAILAFKEQQVATKIQRWFRSRSKKTS